MNYIDLTLKAWSATMRNLDTNKKTEHQAAFEEALNDGPWCSCDTCESGFGPCKEYAAKAAAKALRTCGITE